MPCEPNNVTTRMVIPATAHAVRQTLSNLFEGGSREEMPATFSDTAQIVLSEALNNIVEHAYAETEGEIDVTLNISKAGLSCTILDYGLPMPDGHLPDGTNPLTGCSEDLPEGGYGWFLIRTLSKDLGYLREGKCNRLSFWIPAETTMS